MLGSRTLFASLYVALTSVPALAANEGLIPAFTMRSAAEMQPARLVKRIHLCPADQTLCFDPLE
jgi:hypothetical protein